MESPHKTNRLIYISSDIFYMVIKSNMFTCNFKDLTVETFVSIESRSLMSDVFFWLEIIVMSILRSMMDVLSFIVTLFNQFNINIIHSQQWV